MNGLVAFFSLCVLTVSCAGKGSEPAAGSEAMSRSDARVAAGYLAASDKCLSVVKVKNPKGTEEVLVIVVGKSASSGARQDEVLQSTESVAEQRPEVASTPCSDQALTPVQKRLVEELSRQLKEGEQIACRYGVIATLRFENGSQARHEISSGHKTLSEAVFFAQRQTAIGRTTDCAIITPGGQLALPI